jgi:hypothetical protein
MARDFDTWLAKVNSAIESRCGLSSDDLSDCCYYDWYADGVSPSDAAQMALEENDFPGFEED